MFHFPANPRIPIPKKHSPFHLFILLFVRKSYNGNRVNVKRECAQLVAIGSKRRIGFYEFYQVCFILKAIDQKSAAHAMVSEKQSFVLIAIRINADNRVRMIAAIPQRGDLKTKIRDGI